MLVVLPIFTCLKNLLQEIKQQQQQKLKLQYFQKTEDYFFMKQELYE